MRTYHTAYGYLIYFFVSHLLTNRPGIVFILDLGLFLYSIPKASQIGVC